jgi:hypothetical protein
MGLSNEWVRVKHGSRFGTRSAPSLFYGALKTATVLAEAAYYRFLFWYGMVTPPAGKLGPRPVHDRPVDLGGHDNIRRISPANRLGQRLRGRQVVG